MSEYTGEYFDSYTPKNDWLGSNDNLSFSLRTENDLKESILHLHKSLETGVYYYTSTVYPSAPERPSLWSVLKKWWSWNPYAHKITTNSELDYRQMIALRDWIDEMLYDPEYQARETGDSGAKND